MKKYKYPIVIFWRYSNYLKYSVAWGEGNPYAKNKLDLSSSFDTIPACDRHTYTHTYTHTMRANTAVA